MTSRSYKFNSSILVLVPSIIFASCSIRKFHSEQASEYNLNDSLEMELYKQPNGHLTLAEYIAECKLALGELPETIDCDEESRSSNSVTGVQVAPRNVSIRKETVKDNIVEFPVCDNPTFAIGKFDGCRESSYYDRKMNSNGSIFVTLCRFAQKNNHVPEVEVGAMIGYQPKTGATCFFKYKDGTPWSINGELPGPGRPLSGEADDPRRVWETPGFITNMTQGSCVNCHSAYPWVRNPHTSLPNQKSDFIVPFNTEHNQSESVKHVLPISRNSKYFVVARERLEELWITDAENPTIQRPAKGAWTPVVLDLDSAMLKRYPELKMCTGCHRLGQGRNLRFWSPSAFGIYQELSEIYIKPMFSDEMLTFPKSVWHPIEFGPMKTDFKQFRDRAANAPSQKDYWIEAEKIWHTKYAPVMDVLFRCDRNPQDCDWTTLPEEDGKIPPLPAKFSKSVTRDFDKYHQAHD